MATDPTLKICCPACRWEPDGGAYWSCTCGHVWNTFDTGGICPQCQYRWRHTGCPTCTAWSHHVNWYHGLDEQLAELVEEALRVPASARSQANES